MAAEKGTSEGQDDASQEVIIAVMGGTGTGKSSFIRLATGDSTVVIGEGLQSETTSVESYGFVHEGTRFTLVDTPGFDDTNSLDHTILESITSWLVKSYREGKRLSGILYLHRIIDPRMQGSSLRTFRTFQRLCGSSFHKQVILGTTFWNVMRLNPESDAIACERFGQLIGPNGFWRPMIDEGSKAIKMPDTRREAREMLQSFADIDRSLLQIQEEMNIANLSLNSTTAAKGLENPDVDTELSTLQHETAWMKQIHGIVMTQKAEIDAIRNTAAKEQTKFAQEIQEMKANMELMKGAFAHAFQAQQSQWKTTLMQYMTELFEAAQSRAVQERKEEQKETEKRKLVAQCQALIRQLHTGQERKTVMIHLQELGLVHGTCSRCTGNISGMGNYKCTVCRGGDFKICDNCYNKGYRCLTEYHNLIWEAAMPYRASSCSLHKTFQTNAKPKCSCCLKPVLQVYLHCCRCKEDGYYMCIDCASNGKVCDEFTFFGLRRNHELLILTPLEK